MAMLNVPFETLGHIPNLKRIFEWSAIKTNYRFNKLGFGKIFVKHNNWFETINMSCHKMSCHMSCHTCMSYVIIGQGWASVRVGLGLGCAISY